MLTTALTPSEVHLLRAEVDRLEAAVSADRKRRLAEIAIIARRLRDATDRTARAELSEQLRKLREPLPTERDHRLARLRERLQEAMR